MPYPISHYYDLSALYTTWYSTLTPQTKASVDRRISRIQRYQFTSAAMVKKVLKKQMRPIDLFLLEVDQAFTIDAKKYGYATALNYLTQYGKEPVDYYEENFTHPSSAIQHTLSVPSEALWVWAQQVCYYQTDPSCLVKTLNRFDKAAQQTGTKEAWQRIRHTMLLHIPLPGFALQQTQRILQYSRFAIVMEVLLDRFEAHGALAQLFQKPFSTLHCSSYLTWKQVLQKLYHVHAAPHPVAMMQHIRTCVLHAKRTLFFTLENRIFSRIHHMGANRTDPSYRAQVRYFGNQIANLAYLGQEVKTGAYTNALQTHAGGLQRRFHYIFPQQILQTIQKQFADPQHLPAQARATFQNEVLTYLVQRYEEAIIKKEEPPLLFTPSQALHKHYQKLLSISSKAMLEKWHTTLYKDFGHTIAIPFEELLLEAGGGIVGMLRRKRRKQHAVDALFATMTAQENGRQLRYRLTEEQQDRLTCYGACVFLAISGHVSLKQEADPLLHWFYKLGAPKAPPFHLLAGATTQLWHTLENLLQTMPLTRLPLASDSALLCVPHLFKKADTETRATLFKEILETPLFHTLQQWMEVYFAHHDPVLYNIWITLQEECIDPLSSPRYLC